MPNYTQLAATDAVAIANSGFRIRIDTPTANVIIIIIRWTQITYYYYEIYYIIHSQPQRNSIYDWIPKLWLQDSAARLVPNITLPSKT